MTDAKPDYAEAGRRLFAREPEFYWAAAKSTDLPPPRGLEIAFAGRSNVGKSSLINALTGRNSLARTSHTPGRTQQLNFFTIGDRLSFVDMPGYGYAKVSKQKISNWTKLIEDYLKGRASLARVYVLIDSRHGLKDLDLDNLTLMDKSAVSYQIVLTKADQLKPAGQERIVAEVTGQIARRVAAFPEVLITSSDTGAGIAELRMAILALLRERGDKV